MEEKILLNIGVDEGEIGKAVKAIKDAREKIDELKNANKELEKQGKKNSEEYIFQEAEIKKLNKTVQENSKTLQVNNTMLGANEDSLKALKRETAELIKQRDSFSVKTEEGRAKIAQLNKQIDDNNATIKENSSALEKQRLNIGNYASALDHLVPGLGGFATNLENVKQESGGVTSGIMGMVRSSLAFLATPIGAVIAAIGLALGALMKYFKGSEEGQNRLNRIMAIGGEVMEKITDVIEFLGGVIFDKLGAALSFIGDLAQKVFPGVSGVVKSFASDIIAEADRISSLMETQNKQERELIVERARIAKESTKLRLEADEVEGRSRIEKIDKAIALETELLNKELEFARTKLAIAEKSAADDPTIENKKALAEATAELLNKEAEYNNAIRDKAKERLEILKRESDKRKAEDKEREDQIKKAAATEEEALRLLTEFRLQQEIKYAATIDERVKKEIELANFKRTELLKNEQLTASQIQLIEEKHQAAITEINSKGVADRKALFDADNAERAEQRDILFEQALEDAENYLQLEINKEKQRFLDGEISREEYDTMIQDAELASLMIQQEIRKRFGEEDIAFDNYVLDAKIANKQREGDIFREVEQQKLSIAASIAGQVASLFKKNTLAYKLAASTEAVINTYKAATAAYAAGSSLPGPAGIIGGPLAMAAAIAAGLGNVAKINGVKFKQGGTIAINGPGHEQGGVPLSIGNQQVAEVEGGEHVVVLKRGANEQLKMLSEANKRAGGKDFYRDRRPTRYAADGGFVGRTVSDKVNASLDVRTLGKAFNDAVENLPPQYLKVTDLERVQTNKARVAKISELG